jgi:N-methylhydantoinase B
VIRGTRLPELIARGELALSRSPENEAIELGGLGGQAEPLPAKVELELEPGDILEYTWSGGGGFGDPLERPFELVASDVEAGVLSEKRADRAYGLSADRRDALRRARLMRASAPAVSHVEPRRPLVWFGPMMQIVQAASGTRIDCRCGTSLGSAHGDWKAGAAVAALTTDELPEGIQLHPDLELVELFCPQCGALLSVEICERGTPPPSDLRLPA